MIGSIVPMVYGAPPSKPDRRPAISHALGTVIGASMLGISLGFLGAWLRPVPSPTQLSVVLFSAAAAGLALHEFGVVRLRLPYLRRQVPRSWRNRFPAGVVSFGYGWLLGVGVLTHVTVASLFLACVGAVLLGDPWLGAGIMAVFGVGRASPILWFGLLAGSRARAFAWADKMRPRERAWLHQPDGAILLALAIASVAVVVRDA
jgi:cytochrome c biogenesis protein CcdA